MDVGRWYHEILQCLWTCLIYFDGDVVDNFAHVYITYWNVLPTHWHHYLLVRFLRTVCFPFFLDHQRTCGFIGDPLAATNPRIPVQCRNVELISVHLPSWLLEAIFQPCRKCPDRATVRQVKIIASDLTTANRSPSQPAWSAFVRLVGNISTRSFKTPIQKVVPYLPMRKQIYQNRLRFGRRCSWSWGHTQMTCNRDIIVDVCHQRCFKFFRNRLPYGPHKLL